ncbi:putative nuclease HARBI1 [Merluccius polli]|uniref:Nuclease HARBI1 n=1 Tax=Merluccius polli TaxID=89951 RepID=A0AA47MF14_MERPO|nr:putative nuclease HARBI1 [Merluccius polli]
MDSEALHPTILPKNKLISKLVLTDIHKRLGHAGRNHMTSRLRHRYWIPETLSVPAPSVDANVPLLDSKRSLIFLWTECRLITSICIHWYSVIFTCMATQTIHLEMAYSLDTSSCIRKCHTMVHLLKGQVTDMRSDNGKKLVEAEKELRDALKEINHSQIEPTCYRMVSDGSFNPPKGAHHGGDWERMVSLFLWYLANQNSFRELSDKFDVSQSSAHRCVVEVLQTLYTMVPTFINWFTECEKLSVSAAFRAMCGIENIIGAIDGCHIKLQRPPVRGGDYLNRKGYYSIVLQGIVDSRGKFRDIFVGAPGRVHDSRILRKSTFFERSAEKMGGYMLLGDSAYISREYAFITTPKRDNGALTIQDQRQNTD